MKRILISALLILGLLIPSLGAGASQQYLMPMPQPQYTDASGKPLSGGKLYTCNPGTTCDSTTTTNLKTTYTDSTGATPNTNPIVLNSAGRATYGIWINGYVKTSLYTSTGTLVWSVDNVSMAGTTYEVDALQYGAGTYTQATIEAALTAIGTNTVTLLIRPGTWPITADLSIPANVTLKTPAGTIFQIATTKTLTINGPFEAGLYKVFDCSAATSNVVFGYGITKDVYPQWFGATGIAAHDDTAALKAALASCKASNNNSRLIVPNGNYGVSDTIDITGVSVKGSGSSLYGTSFNVLAGFAGTSVILIDTTTVGAKGGFSIESFRVVGNAVGTGVVGFEIKGEAWPILMQDLQMESMSGDGYYLHGSATAYPELVTMISCRTEGAGTSLGNGIKITEGQNITMINPIFEGLAGSGVRIDSTLMTVSSVYILNPWVEAVATASGSHGMYIKGNGVTVVGGLISDYGVLGSGVQANGIYFSTANLTRIDGVSIADENELTTSYKVRISGGRWHIIERMSSAFLATDLLTDTSTFMRSNSGNLSTNSKSQINISNATQIAGNSTVYICPPLGISSATYAAARMPVSGYMSVGELRVEFLTDPGVGADAKYTVTLYKNGSATAMTVSMLHSGSSTPSDVTTIVDFQPGDYFSIKVDASTNAGNLPVDNLHITLGCLL